MTPTQNTESSQRIDRNTQLASRFLDKLAALGTDAGAKVDTSSFGTHAHTSAMMMLADEITTLRNRDAEGRVGQFLVTAEQRIMDLQLPAEADALAKAAVRALLVHDLPAASSAARQVYGPFEGVIPLASLSGGA